jgi:hypothetical protein
MHRGSGGSEDFDQTWRKIKMMSGDGASGEPFWPGRTHALGYQCHTSKYLPRQQDLRYPFLSAVQAVQTQLASMLVQNGEQEKQTSK